MDDKKHAYIFNKVVLNNGLYEGYPDVVVSMADYEDHENFPKKNPNLAIKLGYVTGCIFSLDHCKGLLDKFSKASDPTSVENAAQMRKAIKAVQVYEVEQGISMRSNTQFF